jgi:hypothetical protein
MRHVGESALLARYDAAGRGARRISSRPGHPHVVNFSPALTHFAPTVRLRTDFALLSAHPPRAPLDVHSLGLLTAGTIVRILLLFWLRTRTLYIPLICHHGPDAAAFRARPLTSNKTMPPPPHCYHALFRSSLQLSPRITSQAGSQFDQV